MRKFSFLLAAVLLCTVVTTSVLAQTGSSDSSTSSFGAVPQINNTSSRPEGVAGTSLNVWGQFVAPPLIKAPSPILAMSTPDYRVTAGDIYQLSYAAGNSAINYLLTVDHSYRVRISNMGIINARNLSYLDFKNQVEALVTRNLPLSGVQFTLHVPSSFMVSIKGEVHKASELTTWALARLSHVIYSNLTEFSSIRNIEITSADGSKRIVDLYKAKRDGDLSQDPYLRPGDTITVQRLQKRVSIEGQVERPGHYQLLQNETLRDLVEVYGNGLTILADLSRIELTRYLDSAEPSGEKIFLTESDIKDGRSLSNFDVVQIHRTIDRRPTLFIEGAVNVPSGARIEASSKVPVRFTLGDNYAPIVRSMASIIGPVSDTTNAYILRDGEKVFIDLNPILYDSNFHSDILIQPGDRLIIPFRQYFVSVTGAVLLPGRYPYIPDRNWDYYVGLAGGFDPSRNKRDKVLVRDFKGTEVDPNMLIDPEFSIYAKTNAFMHYFREYAPLITTILSLTTTTITVINFLNSNNGGN